MNISKECDNTFSAAEDVDRTSEDDEKGVTDVAAAIAATIKRQEAMPAVPAKRRSFKNVFRRSRKEHQGWTDNVSFRLTDLALTS